MKLIYLGTPDFAVPSLDALVAAGFEVAAVLCRPDRPAGRGLKQQPPPVKVAALRHGLTVLQPEKLRGPELKAQLRALEADVTVVVAYGLLVPRWVLDLTPAGCVNVHGSLLPLLRGASPIQSAILQGFPTSGLSLMKLDEGMDTGPVYLRRAVTIGPHETAGELHDRLAALSAEILPEALRQIVSGALQAEPQVNGMATHAPKLTPEMEQLDWTLPAQTLDRIVRALSPRPAAHGFFRGKRVRFLRVAPEPGPDGQGPGTLVAGEPGQPPRVACGEGWLALLEVQPEGKRAMTGLEFYLGHRPAQGEGFTAPPSAPATGEPAC